ncbi:uncharacterized protein LAJ45_03293 [Morchella importuna]|uniref:3-phytase n=1 Tax=Morchella conica CCBAS932 TaxID=1392247 RepID=A0A3N4KT20_9PEZI|nr:uncharacterized protein LAJ45_03293 [Morchella importuna]KAH8152453.1 hypothetical protein LAJ45_03293 [Morchella importuna]RPB13764.1 phosphoglycerate mutase-like protein [Morchella conica CCBAS932]
MTTFVPPPPYSPQELKSLYPESLELHLVQLIFRHGERTPVGARFQETGLAPLWPYCNSVARFKAAVVENTGEWSELAFKRRTETVGDKGQAVVSGAGTGTEDSICSFGELTDLGRQTTLALGQRARNLYINQLGFLPPSPGPQSSHYLRATPVPRALESLQQVYTGLYPTSTQGPTPEIPIIYQRTFSQENLFPNEANCRRFLMLTREFASLAAQKWNDSPEMQHIQSRIGKWVEGGVKVDGKPRLSGIMDTVNATLAHGPATKLPGEFYEPEVLAAMDKINVDEWYRGYSQSSEYRLLGVGSLLGDIVDRMGSSAKEDVEKEGRLKVSLMGCHDTTLAGLLASLGAFDNKWPPFTSSIAFEMFRKKEISQGRGLWARLMGSGRAKDENYYVRLRYNEVPVVVKGCKKPGNHLEGDESFCTLTAFKEIVAKMRPKDWQKECLMNMDKKGIPPVEEVE